MEGFSGKNCKGIRIPETVKFLLVESRTLDFGIRNIWNPEYSSRNPESGIILTIGIQNPSSTDKDWNPVPGIRNPRRGIQNPRLSWIPLHWAILTNHKAIS